MSAPPQIDNTPGLVWRPRKAGWEARWQARTDLVRRGYTPKSVQLWVGAEPTEADRQYISEQSRRLQTEMLLWGHGGMQPAAVGGFDGTMRTLINCYQLDEDSRYRKARFQTRRFYDTLCRRVVKDHGSVELAEVKARHLLRWHEDWTAKSGVSMGHALIGMLRTLTNFGATILEDDECERIAGALHRMKFVQAKARKERLTAEQANAIRAKAHEMGRPSIALAQAFQFECMLRQKDVIGEWVPQSEPGLSDVVSGNHKWLRGIRWSEIDPKLVLRHVTSKRQKEIELDLTLAPMVMDELRRLPQIPSSGPIIVHDVLGVPWQAPEFRRWWRIVADACGIPKTIRNMDSRAGAISEATDAGAEIEHVRQAATHSDIQTTQLYSRGAVEKVANVQKLRLAHRTKNGS